MRGSPVRNERILAVLGGVSLSPSLLAAWANSATFIAAADSGADALLAAGVTPDLVVGDLDSLRADRKIFADVREDPSEASTDCDKLLAVLAAEGHTSVTLINVAGKLPDHELAILQSAARSGLFCRLVFDRGFGHVLVGPTGHEFAGHGRVSLLPLTRCAGASLAGVRWQLDRADLDALGATSISNEAIAPIIEVSLDSGAAFLFIEANNSPSWPH
jgi:thiamine pyrophosphokinase